MYQLKPIAAQSIPQQQANTLAVTQTNGVVSIRLPDGTRISFQKDGLALNAQMPPSETPPPPISPASNPADLQKIAELSAALASSKMDIAKLSQEVAVLQREKKAANDELAALKFSNNRPVVFGNSNNKPSVFPLRSTTAPVVVVPAAPAPDPIVVVAVDNKADEIMKASDVTEENLIKHIAGKFDVDKMVSSDSPQNAKYGASPLLFWAAYGGHAKSIELLLKAGAKRDLKGPSNETALEVCIRKQRSEECIRLLKPPVVVVATPASSFIRQPAPTAPPNFTRMAVSNTSPSFSKPNPVVGNTAAAAPASPVTAAAASASPVTAAAASASPVPPAAASASPVTSAAAAPAPVSPVIPSATVAAPVSPSVSFAATIVEETEIPANPVAATEPTAGDPAPVAAPEASAPDPNRPLTFLEKRRLSASKPPIITGALDVSALRSSLRPAPPKVVPPPKPPTPPPVVAVDGAPPVRVNKLADRLKMFERKS